MVIFDNTYSTNTSTQYSAGGSTNYLAWNIGAEPINAATSTYYVEYYISGDGAHTNAQTIFINSNSSVSSVPGRTFAITNSYPNTATAYLATTSLSITLNTSQYLWLAIDDTASPDFTYLYGNPGGSTSGLDPNDSGQSHLTGAPAWFCMTTLSNFSDCGTPPPTGPSIGFAWPPSGAQILDFQNWVLNVSSTASTTNGLVTVKYGQTSSTLTAVDSAQYDTFVSSNPFVIPKSVLLNPIINLAETSTWYAQACYTPTEASSTCSAQINFEINPSALPSASTSSVLAVQIISSPDNYYSSSTVSSSILENPYSCQGNILTLSFSNCFAWGVFSLAQILFQPNGSAQNYLSGSIQNFQKAPPFSGVFDTYDDLTAAVSSSPASQELDYSLTLGDGTYLNATYTIPFLTSSTMSTAVTPSGKTVLYNLEDAMFDLLTLGLIFFVPWHWWRKKHNANKPA